MPKPAKPPKPEKLPPPSTDKVATGSKSTAKPYSFDQYFQMQMFALRTF